MPRIKLETQADLTSLRGLLKNYFELLPWLSDPYDLESDDLRAKILTATYGLIPTAC